MSMPISIPRKEIPPRRWARRSLKSGAMSVESAKALKHSPSYISISTIKNRKGLSPPHPLVNMSKSLVYDSDSDEDSCNSYDDSFDASAISSYNDSIYSSSPLSFKAKIRSKSSISACTATATTYKPPGSSTSSLSKLLERQKKNKPQPEQATLRNTLRTSLKKSFMNNDFQLINLIEPRDEVEMKTFKFETIDTNSDCVSIPNCRIFRNRDERINANFLNLYALDYSARSKGSLPQSNEINEILILRQGVREFHNQHDLFRISNLSKEKLWSSIILDPRTDSCPSTCIDHSNYVYVGSDNAGNTSITMKHGNYLPWSCKSSLKPTGTWNNNFLVNGSNPNSGVTRAQYTIKGWCNSRWLADD